MNSKWDSCNTHPQWENDGSISSEDEDSLDDSNNDAEKKLWHFIGGEKPNEHKRYALQLMKMKLGNYDVKS